MVHMMRMMLWATRHLLAASLDHAHCCVGHDQGVRDGNVGPALRRRSKHALHLPAQGDPSLSKASPKQGTHQCSRVIATKHQDSCWPSPLMLINVFCGVQLGSEGQPFLNDTSMHQSVKTGLHLLPGKQDLCKLAQRNPPNPPGGPCKSVPPLQSSCWTAETPACPPAAMQGHTSAPCLLNPTHHSWHKVAECRAHPVAPTGCRGVVCVCVCVCRPGNAQSHPFNTGNRCSSPAEAILETCTLLIAEALYTALQPGANIMCQAHQP